MKPKLKTDPFTRDDLREWLETSKPELKESPLPGQELQIISFRSTYSGEREEDRLTTTSVSSATSITSRVAQRFDDVHKPVLDIDMPVKVFESSTPGHFHLYIDKEMSWDDYELLLRALTVVGILEPGYLHASLERKHTSVRLPWVKKDDVKLVKRPW